MKKQSSKKIVLKMPPSWSYSRWSTYENCPRKAKLIYIDGYRTEGSDATNRGTEIHAICEKWLKAKRTTKLPPVLAGFTEGFNMLRQLKAQAELEIGITREWEPCAYDDPAHWWHGKLDVFADFGNGKGLVIDFKTGKIRDYHAQQLELYALAAFITYPLLESVKCELWYLDHDHTTGNEYLRRQVPSLMKLWERRTAPMFNDTTFAPCPNFLCKWCDFRKELGSGLCEY